MSFTATNSPSVENAEKRLKASDKQLLFVSSVSSVKPLFAAGRERYFEMIYTD